MEGLISWCFGASFASFLGAVWAQLGSFDTGTIPTKQRKPVIAAERHIALVRVELTQTVQNGGR